MDRLHRIWLTLIAAVGMVAPVFALVLGAYSAVELLMGLGVFLFLLLLAYDAYEDMEERGDPGLLYALFIVIAPPLGLVAWWLRRRTMSDRTTDMTDS